MFVFILPYGRPFGSDFANRASPTILFGPICVILNIYVSINISNTELIENCSGRIEKMNFCALPPRLESDGEVKLIGPREGYMDSFLMSAVLHVGVIRRLVACHISRGTEENLPAVNEVRKKNNPISRRAYACVLRVRIGRVFAIVVHGPHCTEERAAVYSLILPPL